MQTQAAEGIPAPRSESDAGAEVTKNSLDPTVAWRESLARLRLVCFRLHDDGAGVAVMNRGDPVRRF